MPEFRTVQRQYGSAGSAGTQVDVNIKSQLFRAYSGLADTGAEIVREYETAIDNGKTAKYEADNAIWNKEYSTEAQKIEYQNNPQKLNEYTEGVIARREEQVVADMKGVTKERREKIMRDWDFQKRKLRQSSDGLIQQYELENSKAQQQRLASQRAQAGDISGSEAVIDGMVEDGLITINEAYSIKESTRQDAANFQYKSAVLGIESAASIDEAASYLESAVESVVLDENQKKDIENRFKSRSQQIANVELLGVQDSLINSNSKEEVDAIESAAKANANFTEKHRKAISSAVRARRNQHVASERASIAANVGQLKSAEQFILSGALVSDEQIAALPIDEEGKALLSDIVQSRKEGSFNEQSPDFLEQLAAMKDEFNGTEFFTAGDAEQSLTAKQYKKWYDTFSAAKWTNSAKIIALQELLKQRATESKENRSLRGFLDYQESSDGSISVSVPQQGTLSGTKKIKLDDAQIDFVNRAASVIEGKIYRNKDGTINQNTTILSATDMINAFMYLQSEKVLEAFRGKDPASKEYEQLVQKYLNDPVNKFVEDTARQRLRRKIEADIGRSIFLIDEIR